MNEKDAKLFQKDLPDGVLIGALFLHLLVALKFPNLAYADEVMQTLEQGHRWAFGYGIIPWEFRDGVRSWFLPGIFGALMKVAGSFGAGSEPYLIGVNIFLSICSVAPVAVAIAWARRAKLMHVWLAGAVVAGWFELIYFSSKALTEVFAAWALPAALYFCVRAKEDNDRRSALFAGMLWGLVVGLRVHLAPAALVAIAFTAGKDVKRWVPLVLASGGVFLLFGLLDWFTWGAPFISYYRNIHVNLAEGKAAWFGVSPWWEYLASLAQVWSFWAIPLLVLAFDSFRRWPILGITAGVIFVEHSLIAHKEYRFILPFIVLVVLAAALAAARALVERKNLGTIAALAMVFASLDGARRFDWNNLAPRVKDATGPQPMWSFRSGGIAALASLSTDATLCGLGVVGIGWGWSGGYTYLHRDVPLWDVRNDADLAATKRFANTLVASVENGEAILDFKRGKCFGQTPPICVYRREGTCDPAGDYSINAMLKQQGR